MLLLFFNSKGVVHRKFVPGGQMVTKEFYLEVLGSLLKQIVCVRPETWKNHNFNLYNNVLAYTSTIVQQSLVEERVLVFSHPMLSPNTSPLGYSVFPKLKWNRKSTSTKIFGRSRRLRWWNWRRYLCIREWEKSMKRLRCATIWSAILAPSGLRHFMCHTGTTWPSDVLSAILAPPGLRHFMCHHGTTRSLMS